MDIYVGNKLVIPTPKTRGEYYAYRGWTIPEDENPDDPGYMVEYVDGGEANHPNHNGYISWSPQDVFDIAYRKSGEMTFGDALELLRRGHRMTRKGWNVKGMYVFISRDIFFTETRNGRDETNVINDTILLRNASSKYVAWTASQEDTQAQDWGFYTSSEDTVFDLPDCLISREGNPPKLQEEPVDASSDNSSLKDPVVTHCVITTTRKDKESILVSLHDLYIPADIHVGEKVYPYAVIGLSNRSDKTGTFVDTATFGWVDLSMAEKELIGHELRRLNATPNRWYWCTLHSGDPKENPHYPPDHPLESENVTSPSPPLVYSANRHAFMVFVDLTDRQFGDIWSGNLLSMIIAQNPDAVERGDLDATDHIAKIGYVRSNTPDNPDLYSCEKTETSLGGEWTTHYNLSVDAHTGECKYEITYLDGIHHPGYIMIHVVTGNHARD